MAVGWRFAVRVPEIEFTTSGWSAVAFVASRSRIWVLFPCDGPTAGMRLAASLPHCGQGVESGLFCIVKKASKTLPSGHLKSYSGMNHDPLGGDMHLMPLSQTWREVDLKGC